jgi:hypothetical protein
MGNPEAIQSLGAFVGDIDIVVVISPINADIDSFHR